MNRRVSEAPTAASTKVQYSTPRFVTPVKYTTAPLGVCRDRSIVLQCPEYLRQWTTFNSTSTNQVLQSYNCLAYQFYINNLQQTNKFSLHLERNNLDMILMISADHVYTKAIHMDLLKYESVVISIWLLDINF